MKSKTVKANYFVQNEKNEIGVHIYLPRAGVCQGSTSDRLDRES